MFIVYRVYSFNVRVASTTSIWTIGQVDSARYSPVAHPSKYIVSEVDVT